MKQNYNTGFYNYLSNYLYWYCRKYSIISKYFLYPNFPPGNASTRAPQSILCNFHQSFILSTYFCSPS